MPATPTEPAMASNGGTISVLGAVAIASTDGRKILSDTGRYECNKCKNQFCLDCDLFVHDVLRNCPGCV